MNSLASDQLLQPSAIASNSIWNTILDIGWAADDTMACDERLADVTGPTIRLFTWNPAAISLGRKQPLPEWLNEPELSAKGIRIVRRPTGGALAFHGSDVSLSIALPGEDVLRDSSDNNYHVPSGMPLRILMKVVCEVTVELCRCLGADARAWMESGTQEHVTYCLTQTSPYAVLVGERKVAGFAIRRYPHSWLIQGSVLVRPLPGIVADVLPFSLREQLNRRAFPLAHGSSVPFTECNVAARWAKLWPSVWNRVSHMTCNGW